MDLNRLGPRDAAVGRSCRGALALVATAGVLLCSARSRRRRDAVIRELRADQEALSRQATHDPLTGLPNRVLFHERVHEALTGDRPRVSLRRADDRRTGHAGEGVAVLFLDLDGFKAVNDRLGHRAGDELLLAVAGRLRRRLRAGDLVARLGGDEFGVLLHDVDHRSAGAVADRVLTAFDEPFGVLGHQAHVGVSIGLTLAGSTEVTDVDTLVREADVAMYEAKAAGRGRCVVFRPEMLAAQAEQASLTQDLHGAVARGEIFVRYQPVVDLVTGRVDGVEALARWAHPVRGLVSPATFIPLAEHAGLIDELGAHVLAEASRWGTRFAEAAGRQLSMGVNASASQLAGGRLLELIRTGRTEAMQLLLEVTETTLLRPDVVPALEELRRRDVRIAMDDFGVGHSSIAALRLMPVDALKLDRAFTVDVSTDPRAAAIVRAVSTMARELDLSLIAEGIETAEQLDSLTAIGCRHGQGYLMARPMDGEPMCAYLRARAAGAAEAAGATDRAGLAGAAAAL